MQGKEVESNLIERCSRDLARYKVPKIIEFRKELLLSLIGKVLKLPPREKEKKESLREA